MEGGCGSDLPHYQKSQRGWEKSGRRKGPANAFRIRVFIKVWPEAKFAQVHAHKLSGTTGHSHAFQPRNNQAISASDQFPNNRARLILRSVTTRGEVPPAFFLGASEGRVFFKNALEYFFGPDFWVPRDTPLPRPRGVPPTPPLGGGRPDLGLKKKPKLSTPEIRQCFLSFCLWVF